MFEFNFDSPTSTLSSVKISKRYEYEQCAFGVFFDRLCYRADFIYCIHLWDDNIFDYCHFLSITMNLFHEKHTSSASNQKTLVLVLSLLRAQPVNILCQSRWCSMRNFEFEILWNLVSTRSSTLWKSANLKHSRNLEGTTYSPAMNMNNFRKRVCMSWNVQVFLHININHGEHTLNLRQNTSDR